MSPPRVIGIAASQHNGATCLMVGDRIVAAIAEERLSRIKRQGITAATPSRSFQYCLDSAGLNVADIDEVVICTQTSTRNSEHDFRKNSQLRNLARAGRVRTISHHVGHAMSAIRWAGVRRSAVLVADGLGSPTLDLPTTERELVDDGHCQLSESISMYLANNWRLTPLEKHLSPTDSWLGGSARGMPTYQSLGGMYAAVAKYIFADALEAGKVMGLAPHGSPSIAPELFLRRKDNDFVFSRELPDRFCTRRREAKIPIREKSLAASVQAAFEEAILYLVARLRLLSDEPILCFAGGLALNASANERIVRESGFNELHVIPAADDSGTAVGAALSGLVSLGWTPRFKPLRSDSLGRSYSAVEVIDAAKKIPGIHWYRPRNLTSAVAERIAKGQICGWMQGGAEFGPRALGYRSILGDPRTIATKRRLDSSIKRREAFRPYAPSVMREFASAWFELGARRDSPFMLRIVPVCNSKRPLIPAVVHVDGTARLQTVAKRQHTFYRLINGFYDLTGIPVLLNTSFNVRGEPIVESPVQALWGMVSMGLDFCVIDTFVFELKQNPYLLLKIPIQSKSHSRPQMPWLFRSQSSTHMDPSLVAVHQEVDGKRSMSEISRVLALRSPGRQLRALATLASLDLVTVGRF